MNKNLIQVENISLERNNNKIFDNITLNIYKASITNIFGPNGCGKTSLLKIISGITEPTTGNIKYLDNADDVISSSVYIGHKYGIKNNLTILENLQYSNNIININIMENIKKALYKYDMFKYKNTLAKNLSHGQQKKICLMRAIISQSSLWIIDEPYSALDDATIKTVNNCFSDYIATGGTIVMTNHNKVNSISAKINNFNL